MAHHGQLIEINTWGLAASDPDRYAGIYQKVGGLKKGATYELSLWGLMREEAAHPDEDPYRYRVQWGFAPTSAGSVTNWTELSWNEISLRTAPGPMTQYTAKFVAPSDKIVLAVRAWKKWGTVQRELDVNLDAISLVPCGSSGGGSTWIAASTWSSAAIPWRHRQEEWHNGGRPEDERDQESQQDLRRPEAPGAVCGRGDDPQPPVIVVPPVDPPPVVVVDPAKPPVVIVDPAAPSTTTSAPGWS